jgi:hypothetical protein
MSHTTKDILAIAFVLLVLGFAFVEWQIGWSVIPYYQETATNLRELTGEIRQQFESARGSWYGCRFLPITIFITSPCHTQQRRCIARRKVT